MYAEQKQHSYIWGAHTCGFLTKLSLGFICSLFLHKDHCQLRNKHKALAEDPGMCLPSVQPPTLHTIPTYGLIPFQNTSNQTNNVWQRINKQSNNDWEPLYWIRNESRRNLCILIKRLIVEIAFWEKLSVFTFCWRYLPRSFLCRFKSVCGLDSVMLLSSVL